LIACPIFSHVFYGFLWKKLLHVMNDTGSQRGPDKTVEEESSIYQQNEP